MNVLVLLLLTIAAGLLIGPAKRHDNELPISVTGRKRK